MVLLVVDDCVVTGSSLFSDPCFDQFATSNSIFTFSYGIMQPKQITLKTCRKIVATLVFKSKLPSLPMKSANFFSQFPLFVNIDLN